MASISPLVLEAGATWAGNDGNWSTWPAQIGNPPQQFHILPSTSHGEVWIPGPQGCTGRSAPSDCAASRGVGLFQGSQSLGFLENASSTWEQIGIYEFIVGGDLFQATETGLYGQDTAALGSKREDVINNQTVAGIVTQDFWLGSFGLDNVKSDFPVRSESLPSLLDGMKTTNLTESVSFGLATGASYRSSPGSLVIGGYDQNALQSPSISIPVATNNTRSLVAQMQSLVVANTLTGTLSAAFGLPSLQLAIDTGVSQLWLPKVICDKLAESLGLTFDSSTELYLVNDTIRTKLLDLAPEFTFTLAANATSSETVNIVLPYAAFDLTVSQPFYNTSRHYFPIRRAADENLYVLGRTFMQEAYLVVDWERGNFSVSQAQYQVMDRDVVPIRSVSSEPTQHSGLSAGLIAGVVVAVVVVILIATAAGYFFRRRKRARATKTREDLASPYPDDKKDHDAIELSGAGTWAAEASSTPVHELHQDSPRQQLMSTQIYELPGERVERELEASVKADKPGLKPSDGCSGRGKR